MKTIHGTPRWGLFATTAFTMVLSLVSPFMAIAAPETATPSDSFADSFGVNVKLLSPAYIAPGNSYLTLNNALFLSRIRHIRDGVPLPQLDGSSYAPHVNELNSLAANGVNADLIFSTPIPSDQPTQQQDILELLAPVASAFGWAEGTNEPDNVNFRFNNDTTWAQSAIDFQNVLYSAIKESSQYSGIPVIAPSMGFPPDSSQIEGMQYVSDFGNTHSYHGARNPGTTEENLGLQNFYLPDAGEEATGKPVISTETGNWVGTQTTSAIWMPPITLTSQEKYALRTYAEYYINGIGHTFTHELLCEPNAYNIAEQNFGLLNSDWSERPAFTALKRLTALVGDPGPAFTPG